MAKASTTTYGNDSISMLKGAERVRKRPSVIFGSDGLEGCEHAVFEILSNAIDEAREGFGNIITVTRYEDKSIEVEDLGRGCPVDWNEKEQRYNWELIFCEMYAGGKYKNNEGENYEYSLGLNGLGACATQYASEYMDVTIWRDGKKYSLHFRQGEDRHDHPLAAGSGGVHGHRCARELFPGRAAPAGRREQGRDVSPARAARQHVRDDGLLLCRRHPRLCQGACGRGRADCSGLHGDRAPRTRPRG